MSITSHTGMHFFSVSCNCLVTWYAVRTVEHVILQYLRPFWAQVYMCTASDCRAGAERARARPPPERENRPAGHGRVLSLT